MEGSGEWVAGYGGASCGNMPGLLQILLQRLHLQGGAGEEMEGREAQHGGGFGKGSGVACSMSLSSDCTCKGERGEAGSEQVGTNQASCKAFLTRFCMASHRERDSNAP